MAYPTIDRTRPRGTESVSIVDDSIRDFKEWVWEMFEEISGFPDQVATILPRWDTADRPVGSLKDNLLGYNYETKRLEVTQNGAWEPLPLYSDRATESGDGLKLTMDNVFPSNPVSGKNIHIDTNTDQIYRYGPSGWIPLGGAWKSR